MPSDTAEKIDYPNAAKITKLMGLIARGIATADVAPDYIAMEAPKNSGVRTGLRAYLGTIPDYAQGDTKGVKLSGVRAGSPAEKGGLKSGDVIVEFGSQKIANIYDYTYALDAVKIGTPVKVTVLRDGQRVEVTVTPEARK